MRTTTPITSPLRHYEHRPCKSDLLSADSRYSVDYLLEQIGKQDLVAKMDSMEPEQTPFAAVSAHTSRLTRVSCDCVIRTRRMGWAMDCDCKGWNYTTLADEWDSNTKHGWTSQHLIRHIDGCALQLSSCSSSSGYLSHKDGTSVWLSSTLPALQKLIHKQLHTR